VEGRWPLRFWYEGLAPPMIEARVRPDSEDVDDVRFRARRAIGALGRLAAPREIMSQLDRLLRDRELGPVVREAQALAASGSLPTQSDPELAPGSTSPAECWTRCAVSGW
jgi:hypothetical protein